MRHLVKKALSAITVMSLIMSNTAVIRADESVKTDYTLYVSCDGNDSASGTEKAPLRTLEGAKNVVRNILSKSNEVNIDVIFKGGDYRFTEQVLFDENDSPAEGFRVTYKAKDGEEVNFTGGMELDISKIKLVEDKSILKRLPENARGRVGMLDLKAQGVPDIQTYNPGVSDNQKIGDVQFYLNGIEQTPAEWPNGAGNYARYSDVLVPGEASTGAGGKFVYTENEPSNWGNAKDFYIKAYFNYDYQEYRILGRAVHPEEKSIELEGGLPGTPIRKNSSQRWKAVNLLEALDMPGEWYIDRNEDILYYYPQKSLKDAKFEIALMDKTMIYFQGTDNITFSGITFSKTRNGCFQGINNTENIVIENCNFSDIGMNAISTSGTINSFVDKKYTDSYKTQINGAYGWQIRNNTFINIGKMAIYLVGGDRGTLKSSGNVIENNYIFKPLTKHKGSAGITVQYGCGDVIRNNVIHNSPGHAIDFNGNNYKILNNELYNANREVSDTGIIYTYRSFSARGTEIAYNFLHDGQPTDERLSVSNNGIYWDDNTTGQLAHHNIFANIYRAICANGGTDNSVTNNIFVDCAFATHLNTNFLLQEEVQKRHRLHYESVVDSEVWQKAYPNMRPLVEEYMGIAALNVCKDNYAVRCNYTIYDEVKEYGDVDNNILGEDNSAFVDFNNGDYRLKDSEYVLDADFDMKKIGIQGEKPEELYSDFEQIYPQNGETSVPSEKMTFSWEESIGADQYRIVVATDKELKNVIIDDIAYYNWYEAENLNPDIPVYYWKVYAKNNSYHYKNEWESDNAVFAFAVKENDEVDTSELEKAVENAAKFQSIVKEGSNPGEFKIGTKGEIQNLINESNTLLNSGAKQTAVNTQTNKVNAYLSDDSYIVPGYVDVTDFSEDSWVLSNPESQIVDNTVAFKNAGFGGYTKAFYDSKKSIYRFKMKIDYESENPGWVGLGLRGHTNSRMYETGNDCYFFVIKEKIIELQKNVMSSAIVKEYENTCFQYDKWHDVEFGVIDLGAAVQIILNVDGKNIVNYIDSQSNAIEKTGNLIMTAQGKTNISIAAPDMQSGTSYKNVVTDGLKTLMAGCYKEMSVNGRDVDMIKIGSEYYANKNGVNKYQNGAPFIANGKTYISLEMLKDLFECGLENNILTYKNNTFEFSEGSDILIMNGEEKKISVKCISRNSELFVPFKDICDFAGRGLLWQNSGLIITGDALSISEQNNITLLKNIALTFDRLEEY